MELRFRLPFTQIRISVSFWFFAVVALFFLLDDNFLLYYLALPIIIHESGHLVAMLLCKAKLTGVRFSPFGVKIMTAWKSPPTYGRELFVAAGGNIANLIAAFLLWRFAFQSMRTMLMVSVNLAVAFFNLLPIGNLDGGQIVQLLCGRFLGINLAEGISAIVSFVVLVPLTAVAVFLALRGTVNFTVVLFCLYLIISVICQTFPL